MTEVDKRGTDPLQYDANNPEDVAAYQLALQIAAAAQVLRDAQAAKLEEQLAEKERDERQRVRYQFMAESGLDPSEETLDNLVRRHRESIDYSGW